MKVMLLDGNSLINRAFYAMPVLTNKDGDYTNAVYGFMNIFFKLYDEEIPDYIGIAFDMKKPTFRHEMYGEYKGTRKSMPDELKSQFPLLKNLLGLMNIKMYELEGYEADDLLGSLSKQAENDGIEAVIVSGDRDMLQCASENVKIRIPKTKGGKTEVEDYTSETVIEQLGVTPSEFVDVKALMGDTSDNIPGVPGIGEKTAYKIIREYKTLQNALDHASEITPKKASEGLITYREQALLSQTLAKIITDAPVNLSLEKGDMYTEEAYKEMLRLGFKTLLKRFSQFDKSQPPNKTVKETAKIDTNTQSDQMQLSLFSPEIIDAGSVEIKQTKDEAEYIIKTVLLEKETAYCTITDNGKLYGIAFFNEKGGSFISALSLGGEAAIMISEPFFSSEVEKITINAKRDIVYLNKSGISLKNIVFDESVAAYILDANNNYDYDGIAFSFLGEEHTSNDNFFGKGKHKNDVSESGLRQYALNQAGVIWRAYGIMKRQLEENGQDKLYYGIEHPLISVLADMEISGIKADKNALISFGAELDDKIGAAQSEIYGLSGEVFNINSPKQMGVVLFDKLGLPGGKKTKATGEYSTSVEVLEQLSGKHPIIDAILEYRTYTKLKSTYVEGLLSVLDEQNKIHSTFNQTATATGRLSSLEPNLQNIPVRTTLGRELRKVFIPSEPDFVLLDADYSQIELRVLAHLSGDETFIKAFNEGQDIHRLTASQVLHIPFDEVTPEQRQSAKAVNFGIIYGISAFRLSNDINTTVKEAERYIEGYFARYPKVRLYLDKIIKLAKENGYAETVTGRRRAIPELKSSNFNIRSFGERAAMNMPVQGTSADIIKIAMVNVYKRLKAANMKSKIILQVHDELLLEAYEPELDSLKEILQYEMENALKLDVKLKADMNTGKTWYDAK